MYDEIHDKSENLSFEYVKPIWTDGDYALYEKYEIKHKLADELRSWAIENQISFTALTKLLKIWNENGHRFGL